MTAPSIRTIKQHVGFRFNIAVSKLESKSRKKHIIRPRQMAMFLAREMTPQSLAEIGRRFGNRDHKTVHHAIAVINDLIGKDQKIAADVQIIRNQIKNYPIFANDNDFEFALKQAQQANIKKSKSKAGFVATGAATCMRKNLFELYREKPKSNGKNQNGLTMELLVSSNGSWSILEINGNDEARLVESGKDWLAGTTKKQVNYKKTITRLCRKCAGYFEARNANQNICPNCCSSNPLYSGGRA